MAKLKRKSREHMHEVYFAAFQYYVRIIISDDVVVSRKKRDGILGELFDESECLGMHCCNRPDATSYLFLTYHSLPSTIAHEAWHAVRRMLVFCGAELDSEVVAHHLGYLVGEIHTQIKRGCKGGA
jgi:hypothetical protein